MPIPILHIILVDDDVDDLSLFREAIDSLDIRTELTLFASGGKMMDYLDLPGKPIPDLVFLDMKMPLINGMDCLKEIRKRPEWEHTSVAIYSSFSEEKAIEDTFMEGANIYIEKPGSLKELGRVLEKVLKIKWQYHTSNLDRSNFLFRI